jgi:hypothetical protein
LKISAASWPPSFPRVASFSQWKTVQSMLPG